MRFVKYKNKKDAPGYKVLQEQLTAAKQQAKDRKAKVVRMYDGGEGGVTVQYLTAEGELVLGEFVRVGWAKPPAAVAAQIQAALDSPPEYTVGI